MLPELRRVWRVLSRDVFPVPSSDVLFNPYRDDRPELDLPGGARIRRANLRAYLASFRAPPTVLVVGEAPGPNGCRFTGIPFTSEHRIVSGAHGHPARRSARRERPYRESSGTVLWRAMEGREGLVYLGNAVPLHPHPRGRPLGIRTPTAAEVARFADVLRRTCEALRPEAVVAVGRRAESALARLGIPHVAARHPSHGGVRAFERTFRRVLANAERARSARS